MKKTILLSVFMYSCIFACAQNDKTLEHFQQYGFPPTLEFSIPSTFNIKSMGDKKLFELYEKLNSHYKESSNLEKKMKQEDQKASDTDHNIKKMIEDFHKKESLPRIIGEYEVKSGDVVFGYQLASNAQTEQRLRCIKVWRKIYREL